MLTYAIVRDYAHARASSTLLTLEGTLRKGKLKSGGGVLYKSRELLIEVLIISRMLTCALTYADVCLPTYAKSRELLIH